MRKSEGTGDERLALQLRTALTESMATGEIGIDDALADHLGKTFSLAALIDAVRANGGAALTRLDVLACATIRELAVRIALDATRSPGDAAPARAIVQAGEALNVHADTRSTSDASETDPDAPATAAQEDLWLALEVEDEGAAYHLSTALRFEDAVDGTLMKQAVTEVFNRHPALRTTFRHDGATLRQRVHARMPLDWSEVPLSGPADDADDLPRLRKTLTEFARLRFDLETGPLFRVRLYRCPAKGAQYDVLQFVAHHIVFDAWSRMIVSREIVQTYHALKTGRAFELGQPASEDAAQASTHIASMPERLAQLREYWRERLADIPQVLDVPTDFTRPPVRDTNGAKATRMLPASLAQRLTSVGASYGASLFMTLMAAWQILLARYSRKSEFAIGTPMTTRDAMDLGTKVGYLANTVVVCAQVRPQEGLPALLERVAQTIIGAYEHKDFPLREVIELAGTKRDPSHTPLFQVMFEFHNERQTEADRSPIPIHTIEHDVGAAKYDLSLEIAHTRDGLECAIEYATALFERASIDSMLAQYEVLLRQMAATPDAIVAALSATPDEEYEKVVRTWNATESERAAQALVHERFEARARERPNAVALSLDEETLTYAQLDARADALAAHVLAVTQGRPCHVALCFERSFEMLIAILATLKAGCAYVPIDPRLPAERIDFMLRDSAAALLMTVGSLKRGRFAEQRIETLCLDESKSEAVQCDATSPGTRPTIHGDAAAYVLYTSGSTGTPKGVVVTHANVTNLLDAIEARYPVREGDIYLLKTNYAFDVSVSELFGWFGGHGSLAILAPQAEGSPDLIVQALLRYGVTHMNFTPSMLRPFVTEAVADARFSREHRLKYVLVCGEELPKELANDALHALRPASIENLYGPTEATVFATFHTYAQSTPRHKVPIGRGLANTRVYVLDERMQPMPIGVPGDLYIAGDGVARGYLNRDDLTAQRFLPDPFSPHGRIYQTGDLARWTHAGVLEFLGRVDQQVKVRGYRIELDEVSEALNESPFVDESAVVAQRDANGTTRLVAYIVAAPGCDIADSNEARRVWQTLVAALKQRLPDYCVPSAYAFTASLPRGITGKLSRQSLAAIPVHTLERDTTHIGVAPRNAAERTLCAIWQAVLRVPGLGVTDNFFAIGGDSIIAIQVSARAGQQGIVFSARELVRHQTIEALAAHARLGAPVSRQASAGDMPLLPIHRWFFSIDSTHVDHYQQSRLLDVPPTVDASFLSAWLDALVVRHDALRLRFTRTGQSATVHFVDEDAVSSSVRLLVQEIEDVNAAQGAADAFFADARRQVRLDTGPLFVAALATFGANTRSRLLLIAHHAIVDGVSWRVVLSDLRRAFEQSRTGCSIELASRSDSYQDWARALAALGDSPALRAEREYWLAVLREPVVPFPLDHRSDAVSMRRNTRRLTFALNAGETQALMYETHRAYRTQTIELLLAALLLAAYRWRELDAIRIGLEGHGRETDVPNRYGAQGTPLEIGETLGWFTTYYPQLLAFDETSVDVAMNASRSVPAAIAAVKARYRATPNQGIGYGLLRYLVCDDALVRAESASAPEIVFNYLGQLDAADEALHDIRVIGTSGPDDITVSRPREHKLGINGEVRDARLSFEFDFSAREFETESIQALGEMFIDALREIVQHCKACDTWCPTPADFPGAAVTADELRGWHARHPLLEDLYPASGMQWGMVFHSLLPGRASVYTNQIYMTLGGQFDPARFRLAWEAVAARHAVLRAAFVGFDREEPLQAIMARIELPWYDIDHRHLTHEQSSAEFDALLARDKATPFDFERAPLMRFHLVRQGEARYRFLWTYHHTVLDGWSVQLIWADLLRAYDESSRGQAPVWPAATQFSAFIAWRREHANAARAARHFWRGQIGGLARRTVLNIEQDGLPLTPHRESVVQRTLSATATQQLTEAARACRVTLATIMQAAWAWLLKHYSGESNPVFGVTTSGRSIDLPGVDTIVGPLIATVPARIAVPETTLLRDWLQTVHQSHIEREAHAHFELIEIQRLAALPGGQSLFDSLLIVENYPLTERDARSVLGMSEYGYAEQTHYGLTVSARPGPHMKLEVVFDPSRYHIEDIEIMTEKLEAILHRVPAHLDEPLGAALSGSATNAPHAPNAAADTADTAPTSGVIRQGDLRLGRHLVPQLIEDYAQATPQQRALIYNERAYSYDELNRAANRIANRLMRLFPDLGSDSLVGVRIARSDRLILTILAIWKIGAAYIPIDPVLPEQRMGEMLETAGAKTLIVDASAAALEPPLPMARRAVFETLVEAGPDLEQNPDVHLSANDLSYVLFTSGSTGKPKGAMVEHIGMLNNIANKALDMSMTAESRVAQNASMSFDVSVWQMFIALTQGGTTVVYDDRAVNDIAGLIARLSADGVTILEVVPTYLLALVEYFEDHPDCARPAALTHLLVTGETIDATLLKRWFKCFPATKVINAYGPTEASDDITHHIMSADDAIENPVPIGRALANFDIYVVDDELRPVPIGTKGEIVVTGVGVGRGYVGMAGATAKAFVQSPFPDRYKKRLYRTGDVGSMREDGVLLYHGRKDKQVKIRGMRIELEEIEANLLSIPTVRQAAVLDIKPENREAFLCAYVVPTEAGEGDAIVLALKAKLPPYTVPSVFRFEEQLPQLPSGKIDRRTLRAHFEHAAPRAQAVAPRTQIERRLMEIFSDVLGHGAFGVRDDFFELGGDSFKAIRIAAKYGAPLEVTDIYDHPTIEMLAAHLETATEATGSLVLMSGEPAQAQAVVVCVANSAGGPVSFVETGRALAQQSSELAMFAVKLPRNDVGGDAAMVEEVTRLARAVCDDLAAVSDVPVLVFAQCNGSALAIAIARELSARAAPLRALCIGGALMRTTVSERDRRTDDEILRFLASMGSTLPEQADEQAFFLHDFRYDCRLADVYYNHLVEEMARGALVNLKVPVWCLVGSDDPLVAGYHERHMDWLRIGNAVKLVEYPGLGHYLLRDCPKAVARSICDAWEEVAVGSIAA